MDMCSFWEQNCHGWLPQNLTWLSDSNDIGQLAGRAF
jgi:hypothetical protein